MGNLKTCLTVAALALAACGSDHAAPDAPVVIHDSPVDTKPIDAAPDAPPDAPSYDFSCYGQPDPTTADDPITISGVTTVGQTPTMGIQVQTFKAGVAVAVDSVASGANGVFSTGNIVTAGMPFDGYLKATYVHTVNNQSVTERFTYLYPSEKLTKSFGNAPVPILDAQSLGLLQTVSGFTQDDTNNGMLIVAITDCGATPKPIAGATLTVTQGANPVGQPFDPSALNSQLAGTFVVFNVPDGATDVSASFDGMTFPVHTVLAHKRTNGNGGAASVTETQVRPGP